jgi:hypothetical protein
MDSRDRQIAILNCNTVAAQLAAAAGGDGLLVVLDNYEAAFEAVVQKVLGTISTEMVHAVFPDSIPVIEHRPQPAVQSAAPAPMPTISNGSTVKVIGTQHGDLPAWLIDACAKAGIEKVYDNRRDKDGNDQTMTKRPWFKEALERGSTREAVAFWPPKGR